MSESSDRLEDEFAEVQRCFDNHPQISIVSTDGSPVNQYVIEYRVNGLVQLDDGEVAQSDQHRVELSLSFGFPHFPPNCKPLTQIFHPDIDPSAIKIAEFWNDSTSLAELIFQIGKMICWQVYSEQDGFNQVALDWLKANKDSVPMDTIQDDSGSVSEVGLPEVDLDLGEEALDDITLDVSDGIESEVGFDLDLEKPGTEKAGTSFVDEIDFNFSPSTDSGGVELSAEGEDVAAETEPPSIVEEIDFNFTPSDSSADLDLDLSTPADSSADIDLDLSAPDDELDDSPLELSLENENIKPVEKESFAFVAADTGEDATEESLELSLENEDLKPVEKDSFTFVAAGENEVDDSADIVLEQVAIEEDYSPSFTENSDETVDLDLSSVDVDYDILKGMIDQRNYVAAQKKLQAMAPENISKATSALGPSIEQRIQQADTIHSRANELENEGLLEDAANKLEAVLNLVQDYPNLEADMKRVRDAWAGLSSSDAPEMEPLSLEQPSQADVSPTQVRDTMLTETNVAPPANAEGRTGARKDKTVKAKPIKKKSAPPLTTKKPLIFTSLAVLVALCLSGWLFMEWRSYSQADRKWAEINSLLAQNEYQKAKDQCLEIQDHLSSVKIIKGSGKKDLLGRVDDLLKSEHFLEGLEGKVLYQGVYISKRAHRAYEDIQDLVEEAERQGALSKWHESANLYAKAFAIAEANKKRLDNTFYNDLAVDVKNATFANLVSLGKKAFISGQWPVAIEKFEAALKLSQDDGVADPSVSYDVNRYLQRARFSQYVIDGDNALKADDFTTASDKFNQAYKIAKDPQLIDAENRRKVLVKLNQSSLIKIMADAERFVAEKHWQEAVKSYTQAKTYTMDGYPLVGMGVVDSQDRVEGLLISAIISLEREVVARKRGAKQYGAAEEAYDRILAAIDQSSLRNQPSIQKLRRKTEADKEKVHLKAVVDEQIKFLKENYRSIVAENFTGVSAKALTNPNIVFLGQEERALSFKIQTREQRESKYYTLELIYQYDLDLKQWGFPEM